MRSVDIEDRMKLLLKIRWAVVEARLDANESDDLSGTQIAEHLEETIGIIDDALMPLYKQRDMK